MTVFIPRTLSYQQDGKEMTGQPAAWRDRHAYILLGDAGMGKSELFRHECMALGDSAIFVTVQDFVDFYGHKSADELKGKTLFIDGLDEARSQNGQSVVSDLRQLLVTLGSPRFRLSCRAEEWLGKVDHDSFSKLLPTGQELLVAHLQPFTRDDVFAFLQGEGMDAEQFYEQAERSNLHDLLGNPHMLDMLAKVVQEQKGWPQSKKEVYQLACRQLVTEHNDIHQQYKSQHPDQQLLLAAGYWYATLLLSGRRVATHTLPESDRLLSLNKTAGFADENLPLADVLKTRLFLANGNGEFGFVHRSVAEFLAALYIADCLENGLPLMRVWSLLCIERGVASHLRGLYGWLASLAGAGVRREVMALDPLALLVYGDARHFSSTDKSLLLDALRRQIRDEPNFLYHDVPYRELCSAMAVLATTDMEGVLVDKLAAIAEEESERRFSQLLLNGMEHGCYFPSLQRRLTDIVGDSELPLGLRQAALRPLLAHAANLDVCLRLLEQLRRGEISDPDWALIESILESYYPNHISPDKVLDYFQPYTCTGRSTLRWQTFWTRDLLERTPCNALPLMLTQLAQREKLAASDFDPEYERDELAATLLKQILAKLGDSLPVEQLYQWLKVDLDYEKRQRGESALREWANKYPQRYQALLLHALRDHCPDYLQGNFRLVISRVLVPDWLWSWVFACIKQEDCNDLRPTFFSLAKRGLEVSGCPYTLDDLYQLSCEYPELSGKLDDLYCALSDDDWQRDNYLRKMRGEQLEKDRHAQNQHSFHEISDELENGSADLKALDWLAKHYWRAFPYRQEPVKTPLEILMAELNGDAELAAVCLQALCSTLQRPDLPTWQDLLVEGYAGESACRVALHEMHFHSPGQLLALPDDMLRLAAGLRLVSNGGDETDWYETLQTQRPVICADVYRHYFQLVLDREWDGTQLKSLVRNDYAAVSKLLIPELFTALPQELSDSMWEVAPILWCAGVRHAENHAAQLGWLQQQWQGNHADERVAMLLVMGLMLEPVMHADRAIAFVQTDERGRFFITAMNQLDECLRLDAWPSKLLWHCLQQLGTVFPPPVFIQGMHRSADNDKSRLISNMLTMLSRRSDDESVQLLAQLYACETLAAWRDEVKFAIAEQRKVRRNALFHALVPGQVVSTLKGKAPSSIADLQALVVHELGMLAKEIRDGSGDAYKQFWNEDQYGRVTEPKIENSCRDVLSHLLKERFAKMDVSIIEERQHANTKRADLCFEYPVLRLKLPIEIKRSNHSELWTAVSEQLVPRYTCDPGSHGYGVFLVFWFGKDYVTSRGRKLKKPESATELDQMLNDALTDSERQTIKICVVDVAQPAC